MLCEADVVDAVCAFLESKGCCMKERCYGRTRGEDIAATGPGDRKTSIEAKGETSSNPNTRRYGLPFTSGQVWDHVSKAIYKAAIHFSSGTLTGVAFPHNSAHVECVRKVLPALKQLSIEVFWVDAGKNVSVEHHWSIWG
jgi:hypothetical protein